MNQQDNIDFTTTDILPEQRFRAGEDWTGAEQLAVRLADGTVGKLHLTKQHSDNRFEYRWSKPGSALDGKGFLLVRLFSPPHTPGHPMVWTWKLILQ
jgi:hypothetical protein